MIVFPGVAYRSSEYDDILLINISRCHSAIYIPVVHENDVLLGNGCVDV